MKEQAVLFYGKFGDRSGTSDEIQAVLDLEAELVRSIANSNSGEMDGNDIGEREFVLYMYGPDADNLLESIEMVLRSSDIAKGGYAIARYGEPGADERKIFI